MRWLHCLVIVAGVLGFHHTTFAAIGLRAQPSAPMAQPSQAMQLNRATTPATANDEKVSAGIDTSARIRPGNSVDVGDIQLQPLYSGGHPTAATSAAIGKIDAHFAVDRNGQAAYTIPVKVPPGTQGMEPKLALEYRSSSNNGMVGVGFRLTGLSAIKRCQQTLAQDGTIVPLNNDAHDRFCLDGQRLMAISGLSGTYGEPNQSHGFEREDYMRVSSHGNCNGGPCSFVAYTKNGTQLEFGTTPDAVLWGSTIGWPIQVWALSKITDTRGNYLTVEYFTNNGYLYPQRIDYTGNGRARYGEAKRHVEFAYEERADNEWSWVAANGHYLYLRLKSICTFIDTRRATISGNSAVGQVKTYQLHYAYSQATGRSRLVRVDECGDTASPCFGYTTAFAWQDNDFLYAKDDVEHQQVDTIQSLGRPYYADFNGDGKTDQFIVHQPLPDVRGTIQVTLTGINEGNPVEFAEPEASLVSVGNLEDDDDTNDVDCMYCHPYRQHYFADFDGDGKADFLTHATYRNPSVGDPAKIYRSMGDGTFQEMWTFPEAEKGHGACRYFFGDFNGDGRADVLVSPHALPYKLDDQVFRS